LRWGGRYAQPWTMAEVRPGRNGGLCRLQASPGRGQAGVQGSAAGLADAGLADAGLA